MSKTNKYFLLYKPFGYLSQFTDADGNKGLGSLLQLPGDVYAVGRLDLESEGLLVLTNDTQFNNLLLNPLRQHRRTYTVQVDGDITPQAAKLMEDGMEININGKLYKTMPADVKILDTLPDLPERIPPVRFRKNIPTSWITISLTEGKNHQVRKMTAKSGFPTLRLIRTAIENLTLENMQPGELKEVDANMIYEKCGLR